MAGRSYERLAIEDFGRQLILSGDLDPVYIALNKVDWSWQRIHRWLVAYWCFYHCGLASHASELTGEGFWNVLREAAVNETSSPAGGRWPRGHERRHARGAQGARMIEDLWREYGGVSTAGMVSYICSNPENETPMSFRKIADAVQEHTLFGPWMAFKICDMVDRVLQIPVCFEEAHIFMFKDPVKAAFMLWRERMKLPEAAMPKDPSIVIKHIVAMLEEHFSDLKAPPFYDRPIGLQEIETVLCKWKSHMNGHYPLFNDIYEIGEGLEGWGRAAGEFAAAMPSRDQ